MLKDARRGTRGLGVTQEDQSHGSLRAHSLRRGVWQRFEKLWLDKGAAPGAAAEIETGLDAKLEQLEGRSLGYRDQLRSAVEQARELWEQSDRLSKKHLMYLGAALLYFVSPFDGIPDLLPGIGYADDLIVLTTVLAMVLKAVSTGGDLLRSRAETVIHNAEAAADRAAENLVPRSIASIAIGLWGATTAAAISLALAVLGGGIAAEWAVYVAVVAGLTVAWNAASAAGFVREFRSLSDPTQQRLVKIFAAKLDWKHAVVLGAPVVALVLLAILRATAG